MLAVFHAFDPSADVIVDQLPEPDTRYEFFAILDEANTFCLIVNNGLIGCADQLARLRQHLEVIVLSLVVTFAVPDRRDEQSYPHVSVSLCGCRTITDWAQLGNSR